MLLLSVAMLAACAGPREIISYADQRTPYSPNLVDWAGQSGEFPTEVHGQPFAEALPDEALVEGLRLPGFYTPARLTTEPSPQTQRGVRTVFVFNPAWRGPGLDEVCRGTADLPVRAGGPYAHVAATLCVNDKAVSWLVTDGEIGDSPQDPRYRRLMQQTLAVLLPPVDPIERSRDRCLGC